MLSPGQRYFGEIQTLPGKPNNGYPENYYLEMVLRGEDVYHEVEKKTVKPPRVKKTKTQRKKERNIRQYVMEKIKLLKQEKSRIKQIRVKAERKIHESKIAAKFIPKENRSSFFQEIYEKEKSKIDKFRDENIINERQYSSILNRLKKGFNIKED